MKKCPICGRGTWTVWEHIGKKWFSGSYGCSRCGVLKMDGMIHNDGERSVLNVIPECYTHGTMPVVRVRAGVWRCMECGCEIERDGSQLLRSATMEPELRALAVL